MEKNSLHYIINLPPRGFAGSLIQISLCQGLFKARGTRVVKFHSIEIVFNIFNFPHFCYYCETWFQITDQSIFAQRQIHRRQIGNLTNTRRIARQTCCYANKHFLVKDGILLKVLLELYTYVQVGEMQRTLDFTSNRTLRFLEYTSKILRVGRGVIW